MNLPKEIPKLAILRPGAAKPCFSAVVAHWGDPWSLSQFYDDSGVAFAAAKLYRFNILKLDGAPCLYGHKRTRLTQVG